MTAPPNPYRTPDTSSVTVDDEWIQLDRGPLPLWLALYCYPVCAASCFYATWLVAWFCLGHLPRPMLDDPKYIGGAMDVAYPLSVIVVSSVPLLTPIGFVASFFSPMRVIKNGVQQGFVLAAIYVAVCVTLVALVRHDPGRVIEWWID